MSYVGHGKPLARDPSASLEDWQKFAKTGKNVWFYNGRDRKKTGKILRNGHFGLSGLAVSESWPWPWATGVTQLFPDWWQSHHCTEEKKTQIWSPRDDYAATAESVCIIIACPTRRLCVDLPNLGKGMCVLVTVADYSGVHGFCEILASRQLTDINLYVQGASPCMAACRVVRAPFRVNA